MSPDLAPSGRAPGLLLGDGVVLPDSAEIGAHVVVHSGTVLGEGVRIQDGAVLGKPLALGRMSTASRDQLPPLEVGDEVTICSGAVVLAGVRIGLRAVVGDQAHVRERAVLGEATVIGRGVAVDNDVAIGARVKVQTGSYLTARTIVEDDVFVAPCVTTANDPTAGRHGGETAVTGPTLRRACRIGAGAVLLPYVEIGEEAFVGAGAVVTRDVAPRALVVGVPARKLRDVGDAELLERWR